MSLRILFIAFVAAWAAGCSRAPWTAPDTPTITWSIVDHTTGKSKAYDSVDSWATIVGADSFDVNMLVADSGGAGLVSVTAYILNVQCGYVLPVGHNARPVTYTTVPKGGTVYASLAGTSNNVEGQTQTGLIVSFNSSEGGATQLCPTTYPNVSATGQVLSGQVQVVGTAADYRKPSLWTTSTVSINFYPVLSPPK